MATNDNITGNRMRLLRIERRMTQEEVGQHLGVSKATINKYELGTTQNLSRAKIQALAKLFEVSPAYLMGWTNARDGSDLFTTYPPDQIFPQDARVSYPGLRPDDEKLEIYFNLTGEDDEPRRFVFEQTENCSTNSFYARTQVRVYLTPCGFVVEKETTRA